MHVIQWRDIDGCIHVDVTMDDRDANVMFGYDVAVIDILNHWKIPDDAKLFKVIVAGSRGFNDYEFLKQRLDFLLSKTPYPLIVSGAARGADQLGERYAKERGLPYQQFPAEWNKYGKMAGPLRNQQMVNYADALVAFWNGKSRGTKNVIELAQKHHLQVRIERYEEDALCQNSKLNLMHS
jgi:hypothetical protein